MIPTPQEQVEIIQKLEQQYPLRVGENQAYIISNSWLLKWKEIVGYPPFNQNSSKNNEISDYKINSIDNNDIIINENELDPTKKEDVDFNVLSPEVWNQFLHWFGGGPQLSVPVYLNSSKHPTAIIHRFYIYCKYKNEDNVPFIVFNLMQLEELSKMARNIFKIPEDIEIRFLDFDRKKTLDLNNTIYGNGLHPNIKLIIDYRRMTPENTEKWASENGFDDIQKNDENSEDEDSNQNIYDEGDSPYIDKIPGVCGLRNIGNSCYFNSALQCLMHCVELVRFFLNSKGNNDWHKNINVNNPIGAKGELATSFANLIEDLWSGKYVVIKPIKLKESIDNFTNQFRGTQQQDAHELVTFLLDGIHEDLNSNFNGHSKSRNIPLFQKKFDKYENFLDINAPNVNHDELIAANESWLNHRSKNNSIIVDMFQGLLRSQIVCPFCKDMTVVFDPYMTLSLPLARQHTETSKIIFVPFDYRKQYIQISITYNRSDQIYEMIQQKIGYKTLFIIANRQRNGEETSFFWGFPKSRTNTDIFALEIPSENKNDRFQFEQLNGIKMVSDADANLYMTHGAANYQLNYGYQQFQQYQVLPQMQQQQSHQVMQAVPHIHQVATDPQLMQTPYVQQFYQAPISKTPPPSYSQQFVQHLQTQQQYQQMQAQLQQQPSQNLQQQFQQQQQPQHLQQQFQQSPQHLQLQQSSQNLQPQFQQQMQQMNQQQQNMQHYQQQPPQNLQPQFQQQMQQMNQQPLQQQQFQQMQQQFHQLPQQRHQQVQQMQQQQQYQQIQTQFQQATQQVQQMPQRFSQQVQPQQYQQIQQQQQQQIPQQQFQQLRQQIPPISHQFQQQMQQFPQQASAVQPHVAYQTQQQQQQVPPFQQTQQQQPGFHYAQYPGGPPLLNNHSLYGGANKNLKKSHPPPPTSSAAKDSPKPTVSPTAETGPCYVACVLRLKFRKPGFLADESSVIDRDVSAPFLIQVDNFRISREELNARLENYFSFCWSTSTDHSDSGSGSDTDASLDHSDLSHVDVDSIKKFVEDALFDKTETDLDFSAYRKSGELNPGRVMVQYPSEYYIIEGEHRYFKGNPVCNCVSHIFYSVYVNKGFMDEAEKHFSYKSLFSHIQFVNSIESSFFASESISLDKCFKYFSENEVLDARNQWFCKNCQKNVNANKKMDVWSAPKILVIQLKRFVSCDDCIKKMDANISFPDEFDMSNYLVGPDKNRKCLYKLFAVCEHFGGLMGGHYTAHALVAPSVTSPVQRKDGDNYYENAKWYYFNDSSVKKASSHEAHSHNAYMLFYEKVE